MTDNKKIVLFLDDKPVTTRHYRELLADKYQDIVIQVVVDYGDALQIISPITQSGNNGGYLQCVVIDLHCPSPNWPHELRTYYRDSIKKISLNEGEILGGYLKDKNIPILYLSAYPSKFQRLYNPNAICLDKDVDDDEFLAAYQETIRPTSAI